MGQGFAETSVNNIDKEKFEKNHKAIFGTRESIDCKKCDLSSKQKKGEKFTCPHCGAENE
jgi:Zn finger protein HypA/HybF involved in hydrogenase expression